MTNVLHRQIGHAYPAAASGRGATIRDVTGKDYIDASSGAAVSRLGHSHPDGLAAQRKQFAPLLIETHHVSPVYEYRECRPDETPQAYGERLCQELEAKIDALGGENVIAFVAETVVGATMGAVPAVPGYFQRVREIC